YSFSLSNSSRERSSGVPASVGLGGSDVTIFRGRPRGRGVKAFEPVRIFVGEAVEQRVIHVPA
ncbi:hypothetical protein, partial [Burkholderia multivorans]|uniref:hypothetical protein n=1 Tax=Burkholderia multivorans TaxID=87883 RepID=UPI001C2662AB